MSYQDPPGSHLADDDESAASSYAFPSFATTASAVTHNASVASLSTHPEPLRGTSVASTTTAAPTSLLASSSPPWVQPPRTATSVLSQRDSREKSIALLSHPVSRSPRTTKPSPKGPYLPSYRKDAVPKGSKGSTGGTSQSTAAPPAGDFMFSETVIAEDYHYDAKPAAAKSLPSLYRLPSASPNTSGIFTDERSFLSVGPATNTNGDLDDLDRSVAVLQTIRGGASGGGGGLDDLDRSVAVAHTIGRSSGGDKETAMATTPHDIYRPRDPNATASLLQHPLQSSSSLSELTEADSTRHLSPVTPPLPSRSSTFAKAYSDSAVVTAVQNASIVPTTNRFRGGQKGHLPLPRLGHADSENNVSLSEALEYPALVSRDPDTHSLGSSASSYYQKKKKSPQQPRRGRVQFILEDEHIPDVVHHDPDEGVPKEAENGTLENQAMDVETPDSRIPNTVDDDATEANVSQRLGLPETTAGETKNPPSNGTLASCLTGRRLWLWMILAIVLLAVAVGVVLVVSSNYRSASSATSSAVTSDPPFAGMPSSPNSPSVSMPIAGPSAPIVPPPPTTAPVDPLAPTSAPVDPPIPTTPSPVNQNVPKTPPSVDQNVPMTPPPVDQNVPMTPPPVLVDPSVPMTPSTPTVDPITPPPVDPNATVTPTPAPVDQIAPMTPAPVDPNATMPPTAMSVSNPSLYPSNMPIDDSPVGQTDVGDSGPQVPGT